MENLKTILKVATIFSAGVLAGAAYMQMIFKKMLTNPAQLMQGAGQDPNALAQLMQGSGQDPNALAQQLLATLGQNGGANPLPQNKEVSQVGNNLNTVSGDINNNSQLLMSNMPVKRGPINVLNLTASTLSQPQGGLKV